MKDDEDDGAPIADWLTKSNAEDRTSVKVKARRRSNKRKEWLKKDGLEQSPEIKAAR